MISTTRRRSVLLAVGMALLLVTAMPASASHSVVVSTHTTDTDFNDAQTLTNMTVSGSGDSASVSLAGAIEWSVPHSGEVAYLNGYIYTTDGNEITKRDTNGNVQWNVSMPYGGTASAVTSLTTDGNDLYAVGSGGYFKVTESGNIAWSYSDQDASFQPDGPLRATEFDTTAVVITGSGDVAKINTSTGNVADTFMPSFSGSPSAVEITGGPIYIGSDDGKIEKIDSSGTTLFTETVDASSYPIVDYIDYNGALNQLYVSTGAHTISVLNNDLSYAWNSSEAGGAQSYAVHGESMMVTSGSEVIIYNGDGTRELKKDIADTFGLGQYDTLTASAMSDSKVWLASDDASKTAQLGRSFSKKQSGTYTGKTHTVSESVGGFVDISTASNVEYTVTWEGDTGSGWTQLAQQTHTTAGNKSLDWSKFSGSGVRVSVDVQATGSDPSFTLTSEGVSGPVYPPGTDDSTAAPSGGEITRTGETQLSIDVSDPDFDTGDSVNVTWYNDGNEIGSETISSNQTVTQSTNYKPDGEHTWHVELEDSYGHTAQSGTFTYVVDHYNPQIDDSTASPAGGTVTRYENATLSIDVSDADFGTVDGDTLYADVFIDGVEVAGDQQINSNGTFEYTTAALDDGTHSWHIRVTDNYGGTATSDTFSFDVKHYKPQIDNPTASPAGGTVTAKTKPTLSVTVNDDDLGNDGDTLTAEWYRDGENVATTTHSTSDVSYTTDSLPDGDYTWRVEIVDRYGYTAQSDTFTFTVRHYAPTVDELQPSGPQNDAPTEMSANITDRDFGISGDTVTVEFLLNDDVIDTQTIQANGTVTTSIPDSGQEGGAHDIQVVVSDTYGYEETETGVYQIPGTLYIRNETNHSQSIAANGEVRFVADNEVYTRTTDSGEIDLSGLPVDEDFVAQIQPTKKNLTERTIYLRSIFEQEYAYVLNTTAYETAQSRFVLDDPTGSFGPDSVLQIQRAIEVNGSVRFHSIKADRFGAEGVTATLQADQRYRISIVAPGGTTQSVGPYRTDVSGETVTVRPGAPGIELPEYERGWAANADVTNGTLEWRYSDPEAETVELTVWIHEKGNASNKLTANQTFYGVTNVSGVQQLSENETSTEWVVKFVLDRDGDGRGTFVHTEQAFGGYDIVPASLSSAWRLIFGVGVLILVAGLFSQLNVAVGVVTTALTGGLLWFLGFLGGATSAFGVTIAIFFSVGYYMMGRGA